MTIQIETVANMTEEELYNQLLCGISNRDILDEVLFHLFTKNPEKYANDSNFMIAINEKVSTMIIDYALDNKLPITLLNKFYIDYDNPKREAIFKKMYEMATEGIYDLEDYRYYIDICDRFDHMYILKKDINNITKISSKYSFMMRYFDEVLDFCQKNNYSFSENDKELLDLLFSKQNWNYFEFFDNDIRYKWNEYISKFFEKASYSKEVCSMAFEKLYLTGETEIEENNIKYKIINLIINKYPDYINDYELRFVLHNKEHNQINVDNFLNTIQRMKESNCRVNLTVDYPDFSFLDKAEEIKGDNIFVKPLRGTEGSLKSFNEGYYTIDELRKKEMIIDRYAKVLEGNGEKKLSPFEKFVAAYILVTNFAQYKHEDNQYYESRSVYEFIDKVTDTRIVCVGYTNLLIELLSRSGMEDDISMYLVHCLGEGSKIGDNHAIAAVHIKDPKYNMDLVNLSDPTNDSNYGPIGKRNFSHMLMNYDRLMSDTSNYPNGEKDLHLEKEDLEKLENKLHVINIRELLNQSVSEEQIILALCAINCYVDKNREMPLTNDISETGYSIQDYNEAVLQLDLVEKFVLEDKYLDKSFKELCEVLDEEYQINKRNVCEILNLRLISQLNEYVFLEENDLEVTVKYEFNAMDYINNYSEDEQEMLYEYFKDEIVGYFSIGVPVLTFSINDSISDVVGKIVIDKDKIRDEMISKFDKIIKGKEIKNI